MNRIKKLALKYPEFTKLMLVFITAVIVAGAARIIIELAEDIFNLDIYPLARILIIALPTAIAISIVNVKLAKKATDVEKSDIKVPRLSLLPGVISSNVDTAMGNKLQEMNQKIVVRNIHPGEDKAVWDVAKTLSIMERYYFYYLTYKQNRDNALVAVAGEKIVGCVIPEITAHAGEKVGIIGGIFVDRNVHGKGVGKALADAAQSQFQQAGCTTYYVLVDRYNSPSWNMWLHRGFAPFEFNEQLRVFGWKTLSLWLINSYHLEPGTFILRKKVGEEQVSAEISEWWHFLLAGLGLSFIFWVAGIRQGAPWLSSIPFVLGVVVVSILTHELSHKLAARAFDLKTIFKIWESGLIFSAFLALLGILLPFYGSTFIGQKDWPYNKHLKKMGLIYASGPVASLVLASCFLALVHWANTGWLVTFGTVGSNVNLVIAFVNLLPISAFPFDGMKIFLWNKAAWAILIIWFALLLGGIIFL